MECQTLVDLPCYGLNTIVSGLIQGKLLIICGDGPNHDECYTINPSGTTSIAGMKTGTLSAAAGVFNNSFFVTGGSGKLQTIFHF